MSVIVVRLPFGPVIVIVVVPAVSATMLPLASTVATAGLLLVYISGKAVPVVLLLKVAVVVSVSLPPRFSVGFVALPVLPLPLPVGAVVVRPVTARH